jgi:hypothetical protein
VIELRVVPDPLAFPNPEPAFWPLLSFTGQMSSVSVNAQQLRKDIQSVQDQIDVMIQQLRTGIISMEEARAKILGGL